MTTLSDENRIDIVRYRMGNANTTLAEVEIHKANGFAASALLIAYGIETKSHDGGRQQLGKQMVLTGKLSADQGRFYSQLFSKRTSADYDDFISQTLETVDDLLPNAKLFVKTIEEMINDWLKQQH